MNKERKSKLIEIIRKLTIYRALETNEESKNFITMTIDNINENIKLDNNVNLEYVSVLEKIVEEFEEFEDEF
ncbi:hypothetical protein [Poseidonibacter ostreae]|uniref:Phage protein n=1 Tax=Poseidonibacter ostreae TaxID=2654171 RepID=A0A6L4WWN1_9BACT|nr:hypothetical protein [Poseidonibacter ostreae]KAB7891259.1 hypothetical protein GBG19_00050 [Poseidonibacter ostreae]